MEKDIKILVVDDMVTSRHMLSKIASSIENVIVIGTASSGKIALSKIALLKPDLVLLDIFMPEMDGLETLVEIKKRYPGTDVIMFSSSDMETAKITMKALESGALDFVPKPYGYSMQQNTAEVKIALSRLIPMVRTRKYSRIVRNFSINRSKKQEPVPSESRKKAIQKHVRQVRINRLAGKHDVVMPPPVSKPFIPKMSGRKPGRIDIVVIGVSTGGPNALQDLIPRLDPEIQVPVLIVQHMPPMFTASLASRLDSTSAIRVVEASDRQPLEKGFVYIAPGGLHMLVKKSQGGQKIIALSDAPPVKSCRPSVDVMFLSVAAIFGSNVLAAILTGMGNDGTSGVNAIRRKGGYCLVQDEKSSVIWGMPGAVAESGDADEIISLDSMAPRIMNILSRK